MYSSCIKAYNNTDIAYKLQKHDRSTSINKVEGGCRHKVNLTRRILCRPLLCLFISYCLLLLLPDPASSFVAGISLVSSFVAASSVCSHAALRVCDLRRCVVPSIPYLASFSTRPEASRANCFFLLHRVGIFAPGPHPCRQGADTDTRPQHVLLRRRRRRR